MKGRTSYTFSTDFKYNESLSYDKRGNILTLQRNGLNGGSWTSNGYTAATYGLIDNLVYTYNDKNQVSVITESSSILKGYKKVNQPYRPNGMTMSNSPVNYAYDANGNMIKDESKGISSIEYNYLNLPQKIRFAGSAKEINFVYDASGFKLRKIVSQYSYVQTTDYVGGVEYLNNTLQRVANTEGAVTRNADGTYAQEYVLRDHLGNTRITFKDKDNDGTVRDTDIVQINHYYPFGLNMEGNWNGGVGKNKYQYNSKELNSDFGLEWNDYGARFYDAAIGRFPTVDPLASVYRSQNPYTYAANNPIRYIDFMGLGPDSYEQDDKKKKDKDGGTLPTVTITAKRPSSGSSGQALSTLNGFFELGEKYMQGVTNSVLSNVFFLDQNIRVDPYEEYDNEDDAEMYARGQNTGDAASLFFATVELVGGLLETGGGLAAEVPTGGLSTVAVVGGVAVSQHAIGVGASAALNIYKTNFSKDGGKDRMKGGKKKDRDRDLARYGNSFSKWYHQYKQKMQPGQTASQEQLKQLNELWKKLGSPDKFHKGQL